MAAFPIARHITNRDTIETITQYIVTLTISRTTYTTYTTAIDLSQTPTAFAIAAQPPTSPALSGADIGAIVGSVLGFILLLILIALCVRAWNRDEEDYPDPDPEPDRAPDPEKRPKDPPVTVIRDEDGGLVYTRPLPIKRKEPRRDPPGYFVRKKSTKISQSDD
ncbi:hypothetical protein MMC19_004751 [Ptychographa xylographoides]|nr:hypothetical protein [Ptychographa xylographoides]